MKPKNKSLLVLSSLASLSLSACVINAEIEHSDFVTKPVPVSNFTSVEAQGPVNLRVSTGSVHNVRIGCEEGLEEWIQTTVQGSALVISTSNDIDIAPSSSCTAEIVVPDLKALRSSGSGHVEVHAQSWRSFELAITGSGNARFFGDCRSLDIESSGSGELVLEGHAGILTVQSQGSGDLDASLLFADTVVVSTRGSGDLAAHASYSVVASGEGSGDIAIYGSPFLRQATSSGSGRVYIE